MTKRTEELLGEAFERYDRTAPEELASVRRARSTTFRARWGLPAAAAVAAAAVLVAVLNWPAGSSRVPEPGAAVAGATGLPAVASTRTTSTGAPSTAPRTTGAAGLGRYAPACGEKFDRNRLPSPGDLPRAATTVTPVSVTSGSDAVVRFRFTLQFPTDVVAAVPVSWGLWLVDQDGAVVGRASTVPAGEMVVDLAGGRISPPVDAAVQLALSCHGAETFAPADGTYSAIPDVTAGPDQLIGDPFPVTVGNSAVVTAHTTGLTSDAWTWKDMGFYDPACGESFDLGRLPSGEDLPRASTPTMSVTVESGPDSAVRFQFVLQYPPEITEKILVSWGLWILDEGGNVIGQARPLTQGAHFLFIADGKPSGSVDAQVVLALHCPGSDRTPPPPGNYTAVPFIVAGPIQLVSDPFSLRVS